MEPIKEAEILAWLYALGYEGDPEELRQMLRAMIAPSKEERESMGVLGIVCHLSGRERKK